MNTTSTGLGERPPHLSVLYHEIIRALSPVSPKRYLDGTLGSGGHAEGILNDCTPDGQLIGLDIDLDAIDIAKTRLSKFGSRVIIRKESYFQAEKIISEVGWGGVDGIILDLGVSSMQIDRPERGFSFKKAGVLDMRFDVTKKKTAADLVNSMSEEDLSRIIWKYGEERHANRIAKAIVISRPIYTTEKLAEVIHQSIGFSKEHIDSATRTFQALRIALNEELSILEGALPKLITILNPGGILAVITFHSLEDRIVKQCFKLESSDCICPPERLVCNCGHKARIKRVNHRPIRPSDEEVKQNPRARSAKLRIAEKL